MGSSPSKVVERRGSTTSSGTYYKEQSSSPINLRYGDRTIFITDVSLGSAGYILAEELIRLRWTVCAPSFCHKNSGEDWDLTGCKIIDMDEEDVDYSDYLQGCSMMILIDARASKNHPHNNNVSATNRSSNRKATAAGNKGGGNFPSSPSAEYVNEEKSLLKWLESFAQQTEPKLLIHFQLSNAEMSPCSSSSCSVLWGGEDVEARIKQNLMIAENNNDSNDNRNSNSNNKDLILELINLLRINSVNVQADLTAMTRDNGSNIASTAASTTTTLRNGEDHHNNHHHHQHHHHHNSSHFPISLNNKHNIKEELENLLACTDSPSSTVIAGYEKYVTKIHKILTVFVNNVLQPSLASAAVTVSTSPTSSESLHRRSLPHRLRTEAASCRSFQANGTLILNSSSSLASSNINSSSNISAKPPSAILDFTTSDAHSPKTPHSPRQSNSTNATPRGFFFGNGVTPRSSASSPRYFSHSPRSVSSSTFIPHPPEPSPPGVSGPLHHRPPFRTATSLPVMHVRSMEEMDLDCKISSPLQNCTQARTPRPVTPPPSNNNNNNNNHNNNNNNGGTLDTVRSMEELFLSKHMQSPLESAIPARSPLRSRASVESDDASDNRSRHASLDMETHLHHHPPPPPPHFPLVPTCPVPPTVGSPTPRSPDDFNPSSSSYVKRRPSLSIVMQPKNSSETSEKLRIGDVSPTPIAGDKSLLPNRDRKSDYAMSPSTITEQLSPLLPSL